MVVSLGYRPFEIDGEVFGVENMPDGSGQMVRFDFESKSWVPDVNVSFGEVFRKPAATSRTLKSLGAEGTFEVSG